MNRELLQALRTLTRSPPKQARRVAACLYVAGIGSRAWPGPARQAAGASALRLSLGELDVDARHYAAATLYSLMLGPAKRRRLAAFFTPPRIVHQTIAAAVHAGLRLDKDRIADPAAGGAAFLSSLAGKMRDAGADASEVRTRLFGMELDTGLARLANRLIDARLGAPRGERVVKNGDALALWNSSSVGSFDGVVANPPYGRVIGPRARKLGDMSVLVDPAHVNRYALFAGLAVRLARPGGVIALVIPTSFLAGPLFGPMRRHLRSHCAVASIDLIADRDGTFIDVQQDTCVLVLRKSAQRRSAVESQPACSILVSAGEPRPASIPTLPTNLDAPWTLPSAGAETEPDGGATLADYGVDVRAGYFVWNRERRRLTTSASPRKAFPLIWARNVRPGEPCTPAARSGSGIDYVRFDSESAAILRKSAIVLQRTTNNRQPRRLVGALVPESVPETHGGFITENHTLVLSPAGSASDLGLVLALISTAAVDQRYRRISVGSHVSVSALRALPLPEPDTFRHLFSKLGDAERAARLAYEDSARSVTPLRVERRRAARL
jgi:adenine-specific DNA-methyltransferase